MSSEVEELLGIWVDIRCDISNYIQAGVEIKGGCYDIYITSFKVNIEDTF